METMNEAVMVIHSRSRGPYMTWGIYVVDNRYYIAPQAFMNRNKDIEYIYIR